jgi:hypothetical protein
VKISAAFGIWMREPFGPQPGVVELRLPHDVTMRIRTADHSTVPHTLVIVSREQGPRPEIELDLTVHCEPIPKQDLDELAFEQELVPCVPNPVGMLSDEARQFVIEQAIVLEAALVNTLAWHWWRSGLHEAARVHLVCLYFRDQAGLLRSLPIARQTRSRAYYARGSLSQERRSELEAALGQEVVSHVQVAHDMLRSSWDLTDAAKLVMSVAAAEVGVKRFIAQLVPLAAWLMEELQAPPVWRILRDYVKQLPLLNCEADEPVPKYLVTAMQRAAEHRNKIVHSGRLEMTAAEVDAVHEQVRDLMYLLDFYSGQEWARGFLSKETRDPLGL